MTEQYGMINGSLEAWAQTDLYPDLDNEDNKAVVFEKAENGSRTLTFNADDDGIYPQEEEIKFMIFVNPAATYPWGDGYLEGFQAYYKIAKQYLFNHIKTWYGLSGRKPFSEGYENGIAKGVPFQGFDLSAVEVDHIFEATVKFAEDSYEEGYSNTTTGSYGSTGYESQQTAKKKWYYPQTPKSSKYERTPVADLRTDFTFSSQGGSCPVSEDLNTEAFSFDNVVHINYSDPENPTYDPKDDKGWLPKHNAEYKKLDGEYTVVDKVGEFTCTQYYYNWGDIDFGYIYEATGTLNETQFLGFAPYMVLFKGADVSIVDMDTDQDTGEKRLAWKVTYHFSYNGPKQVSLSEPFVVEYGDDTTVYYAPLLTVAPSWCVVEIKEIDDTYEQLGEGNVLKNDYIKNHAQAHNGVKQVWIGWDYLPSSWKKNPPTQEEVTAWRNSNDCPNGTYTAAAAAKVVRKHKVMCHHYMYMTFDFNTFNIDFNNISIL